MKTILIIDDDDLVRESLTFLLKGDGFDVITAEDGKQGLARLGEASVDLVITDILMPNLDGLEFIKQIRSTGGQGLPILAISGGSYIGGPYYAQVAQALGADAALPKPFDNDQLREAIRTLLEGAAD